VRLGKFCTHTRFELGDGSKVRLWHDIWCGDMVTEAFPILSGIACAKDASIAAHVKFFKGVIQWNMKFVRVTHD
jgi:hypothetical protein